jgi:hypothetical protein
MDKKIRLPGGKASELTDENIPVATFIRKTALCRNLKTSVIPMVPVCSVVQNKVIGDVGIVSSFGCVDENLSDVESGDSDGNDNRIIKNVVTKKRCNGK